MNFFTRAAHIAGMTTLLLAAPFSLFAQGTGQVLQNPLGNITLIDFFLKILDIIIVFAIPIIVFFIILAGFQYVTANGNAEKIKSATSALTWAVIGGVLILGARTLLVVIQNIVQSLRG